MSAPQTQYRFVFDQNKCVACHACVVACSIENQTTAPHLWRSISRSNPAQLPGQAILNFSMACNHCEQPVCMHNCPALAYERHPITGAILLNSQHCIGCQYCTWVCPYDAPKFDLHKGYTQKCTFCNHRILEGLKPACASLCPTGALDFEAKTDLLQPHTPGIGHYGLGPSVRVVPLRPTYSQGPQHHSDNTETPKPIPAPSTHTAAKITARGEWTLVVFSLSLPLLWAGFITFAPQAPQLAKLAYVAALGVVGILSAWHLGRKERAWRAVLNLRRSWLSREIFFFGAFALSSTAALWLANEPWLRLTAIALGAAALYSIDRVYTVFRPRQGRLFHPSTALINGLFFAALLAQEAYVVLLLVAYKLLMHLYQSPRGERSRLAPVWLLLLVAVLLVHFLHVGPLSLALALLAETVGRILFYNTLQLASPSQVLAQLQQTQSHRPPTSETPQP